MGRTSALMVWGLVSCLIAASETMLPERPYYDVVTLEERVAAITQRIEENPQDASNHLFLGGTYNVAYARDRRHFVNRQSPRGRSGVPMSAASLVLPVSSERLQFLAESILAHQRAVALDERNPHAWLGLGYACAEAAKRCTDPEWPKETFSFSAQRDYDKEAPRYWEDHALAAYRKARELNPPEEETRPLPASSSKRRLGTSPDWAALGIIRIYGRRDTLSPEEEEEVASLLEWAVDAGRGVSARIDLDRFHYPSNIPPSHLEEARRMFPDVPLEENAAEYFLQAAGAYNRCLENDREQWEKVPIIGALATINRFELEFPPVPWADEVLAAVRAHLEYNQEALRLAHEGASLPQCAFPRYFRARAITTSSHLPGMNDLAEILALQALYQAEEEQPGAAAQSLVDVFLLARALTNEPGWQLATRDTTELGMSNLELVLNRIMLGEAELIALQEAVAAIDVRKGIYNACRGEKWVLGTIQITDEAVRRAATQKKQMELAKPSEDPSAPGTVVTPSPEEIELTMEELEAARDEGQAMLDALHADSAHVTEQTILLAQRSFSALYEQVKVPDDLEPGKKAPPAFGSKHFPMCGAHCLSAIRIEARLRAVQTALAVERYRLHHDALPETLEDAAPYCVTPEAILDPYNDQYLNYQVDDEKYLVYSVADKKLNQKVEYGLIQGPTGISFAVYRK